MISDFRGGKIFADGELLSNNGFFETIEMEPEPIDLDIDKPSLINIKPQMSASFIVNGVDLNKETGELLAPKDSKVTFVNHQQEQIRKHHKTRINKKWAKRYGYRQVEYVFEIESMQINQGSLASENFTYDMVGHFKEKRICE